MVPEMLITERLKLKDIMSKTEEEIADFFLREGENLEQYFSRSLAEATYTSPATIVRMCRRLGFTGFDDFKEQFLAELRYLNQQTGEVDVNFPFAKGDSPMKAANRMARLYEEVTRDTLSLLRNDFLWGEFPDPIRLLQADSVHTGKHVPESGGFQLPSVGEPAAGYPVFRLFSFGL